VIKELKKEDLGISIVVTGEIEEVKKIPYKSGLKIHTIHYSLGVFGNKKLLPDNDILKITTMCGHHCISPDFVSEIVQKVSDCKISLDDAASSLSRLCVCGIFNKERTKDIIKSILSC